MNKVDEEILAILKETFLCKKKDFISQDDYMRVWILRVLLATSVLAIIVRIFMGLSGKSVPSEASAFLSMPIVFFFGFLFIHINNRSENTSLILFVLTWLSIVVALYV